MEYPRRSTIASIFDAATIIDNSLSGWVEANKGLVLLEGHKIVMRRDYRKLNQVRILSGGWSGFEPMYTGFVGPGMLTAAIIGNQYCSPPFPSILIAIRELAYGSPYGVLLVVINHPVSKINFLLAVESAIRENIPVKLVLVADDCSGLAGNKGRKGMAGISFIFKIAGAMADEKRSLEEICHVCSEIGMLKLATVSINIAHKTKEPLPKSAEDVCSMSGVDGNSCFDSSDSLSAVIQINEDATDKGGSISSTHTFSSVSDLSKTILGYTIDGTLSRHSICIEDSPIVILVNNYGYMLDIELNALIRELSGELRLRRIKVERIYSGTVMSSRIIGGFSLTVMKVNESLLDYLDHPVTVFAWPVMVLPRTDPSVMLPKRLKGLSYLQQEPKVLGPILSNRAAATVRKALEFASLALISCEEQVNKLCVEPYYNYGSHIKLLMEAIMDKIFNNVLKINCPYALFLQLSEICSDKLQDNNGTIYACFFDGISQSFLKYLNEMEVTPCMWVDSFKNGIKAIEYYFDLKRGERTMLDTFYPMLEAAQKSPLSFVQIAEAAEIGSLNTVNANDKQQSMPEPSTHVVALWARAVAESLNTLNPVKSYDIEQNSDDELFIDDYA